MLEREIEWRLGRAVKALGGLYYKFTSPGSPGVPDRLIILPGGRVVFVELKTETGRLSRVQSVTIDALREHGAEVRIVRGISGVRELINELRGGKQ